MATKEEAIDLVFKKYRDIKRIYFDKMENRMKDSIREGYNAGFNDGCAAKSEELHKARDEAYQNGYADGERKHKTVVEEMYTLSDEAKAKAYEEGYQNGKADCREENAFQNEESYHQGYDDGYKQGFADGQKTPVTSETVSLDSSKYQEGYDYGYEEGLNDMWDAVKKIRLEAGLPLSEVEEIFGIWQIDIILKQYSAKEVIEKLNAYESGKDKNAITNKEKLLEIFGDNGLDFAAWWDNLWLEAEYKEPKT